jgi:hypothetical protein
MPNPSMANLVIRWFNNFDSFRMACYWIILPIGWVIMQILIHNESKSTSEFTRFCSELGEF